MSIALPVQIDYEKGANALPPNSKSMDVVIRASNGNTFGENSTIAFDLNSTGFLQPDSLYIRYKYAFTNVVGAEMLGTPVYTPFQRLAVTAGSNQIESISNYNQVAYMITNLGLSVSERYGLAASYGYFNNTNIPDLEQLDGRILLENEVGSFAAPLHCVLSNSDKFLPLFGMPQIRVELTVDSLSAMFRPVGGVVPTGLVLSNVELCYKQIDMGSEIEAIVRQSGMTHIKSHSFMNSAALVAASTVGQISLVYNTRLSSIKSLFLLATNNTSDSCGKFDAVDITKSNGSYQFQISGTSYPQTPYSTSQNKAGILMALRQAVGSIFDRSNSVYISSIEYNRLDGDVSVMKAPGKFIPAVDTEIVDSSYILSGISSANSAISVQIQLGTATTDSHSCNLVIAYDSILEVDFTQGQVSVKM